MGNAEFGRSMGEVVGRVPNEVRVAIASLAVAGALYYLDAGNKLFPPPAPSNPPTEMQGALPSCDTPLISGPAGAPVVIGTMRDFELECDPNAGSPVTPGTNGPHEIFAPAPPGGNFNV